MIELAQGEPRPKMGKTKSKSVTCEDCFFPRNMLCALDLDSPCSTFRPAERNLAPEQQLSFVFRTARTRSAYAFPPAQERVAVGA